MVTGTASSGSVRRTSPRETGRTMPGAMDHAPAGTSETAPSTSETKGTSIWKGWSSGVSSDASDFQKNVASAAEFCGGGVT
jgi:hypothetical protein